MNQNKSILSAICLTICLLWLNPLSAEKLCGYDIIYKAEEKENGSTQISDSTMILINAKGQKRVRHMKVYRKDFGENLKDERSITFFLSPADIKNTTYLSYDYDDGDKDDDSWLYLPSLKKVKRLASSDKSDAFLGSDFTFTDITSSKRHFWNYTILSDKEMVDGKECWLVEGTPKEEIRKKVIRETGYTKVNIWISKDNFVKVKGKFWIKRGKRIKFFKATDVEKIDDIWTTKTQQMVTTKAGRVEHSTIMTLNNVTYNEEIDDTFFTTQRMERG
ncbi:MAG: outer membrane lipoprotein-sorting protein, partial [Deltaproteobacteria bacterium]|nr:outer membrane lipoprotein-sorting protein [Deltaproteobacteria bacterium]